MTFDEKIDKVDYKHNTIEKIKLMLREYEREDESLKECENKKNEITNTLKSTLNLINEDPKNKYERICADINEWVESTKLEMEMTQNALEEITESHNKDRLKKQQFSEKIHIYRESMLSVMFLSDKNLKSLYYLILTLFLWLLVWVIINDHKSSGQFIDTNFWVTTFSGLPTIALYWFMIFFFSYIIVFYIKIIECYAKTYNSINYYLFFSLYIGYQAILYLVVHILVFNNKMPIPCAIIIAIEMARLSMKIHGYFREKMLFGLKEHHMKYVLFSPFNKSGVEADFTKLEGGDITINSLREELSNFTYYLFCPSMVYRDKYPRITRFRYHYIFAHFANFSFCILFYYILMRYICEPYFNYSKIKDYYSIPHFIFDCLRFAIPGVCFLVVGFFLLLHSWLNLWSELLRHGDRRFYEDWWTCTNFEEYYRKWNMVVHEWLYYYIYNDTIRFSLGKMNRTYAKFMVFTLSVIVHELIIWLALGFFFPILSIFFGGPGIMFTYIRTKKKQWNIMFWTKLFIGKGIILLFYLREINVRAIIDQIGLLEWWHEYIPRTILMYMSSYKTLIEKSPFY